MPRYLSEKKRGYGVPGFRFLAGLGLGMLLWGCASSRPSLPEALPPELPDGYAAAIFPEDGEATSPGAWWESFGSRKLNLLVREALLRNFDIREAVARVEAARAGVEAGRSAFWPELSLSGELGQQRTGDGETGNTRTADRYSTFLGASYEIDAWGRIAAASAADGERFRATAEDLESVSMGVAATVVEIWLTHRQTLALKALVERQIREEETLLNIEKARFVQGMASALDVLRQQEVLLAMVSRLPELEADLDMQTHRLALLTGTSPALFSLSEESRPEEPALLPALPNPGLPLGLLENRPDIRAAKARLLASGWDRNAAEALRLPRLTLSARGGLSAASWRLIGQGWLLDAAAGVALPVFDAGKRKADVRRMEAQMQEKLAAYERSILTAVKEVEDALILEARQQSLLEETALRLHAARLTLEEALRRYGLGGDNFDAVLTARSRIRELEERRLTQETGHAQARISLHRALGGHWLPAGENLKGSMDEAS